LINEIIKGLTLVSLERIVRLSINLLVGIFVARSLGPNGYAVLQTGLLLYFLCGGFLYTSLRVFAIGTLNHSKGVVLEKDAGVLKSLVILLSVVGFILGSVYLFLAENGDRLAQATILACVLFQSLQLSKAEQEASSNFTFIAGIEISVALTYAVLKVIVCFTTSDVVLLSYVYAAEFFCLSMLYTFKAKVLSIRCQDFNIFRPPGKLDKTAAILPFVVSAIVANLYLKVDQMIVVSMFSKSEFGVYAAAYRMVEIPNVIYMILATYFTPRLSKAYETDNAEFDVEMRLFIKALFLVALFSLVFLHQFSSEVTYMLFGEQYDATANFLKILIIPTVFTAIGYAWTVYLTLASKAALILRANLITLVVVFFSTYPAAIYGGVLAVAWAASVSFVVVGLYAFFLFQPRKFFGYFLP